MRKHHGWALAALGAALLLALMAGPARSQRPPLPQEQTLAGDIAARAGLKEADVAKMLQAMGPAITERLARGQTIDLPNFGQVRTVRIPEHKDLGADGRPVTIAAVNNVDFVPVGNLVNAANSPNAVPAITVPQFQYNPIQNRVPSTRQPSSRLPGGF